MLIEAFYFNFNASYNIFAAFLLVATLIESAAEEILFRGYSQTELR